MSSLETVISPLSRKNTSTPSSQPAADFCKYHEIQLRREGRSLLDAGLSTDDYLDLLLKKRCYADARRVLAHLLPKRRALWWGCLCGWDAYRPHPPEDIGKALQAVVGFILDPNEINRRATAERAAAVEPNSLAHCLAMAAFCSDGSLAPAGLPCVPPSPFLTGRLVGVTVYLASVLHDPIRYIDHLREYLAMGMEISRGNNLWMDGDVSPPEGAVAGAALPALPAGDDHAMASFQFAFGLTGLTSEGFRVQPEMAVREDLVSVGTEP